MEDQGLRRVAGAEAWGGGGRLLRGAPPCVPRPRTALVREAACRLSRPRGPLLREVFRRLSRSRTTLLREAACRRPLPLKAPRIDVPFQPANHHVLDAPAHGRAHLAGAGEAHRVEHLQQAGEGAGVAVVRGGGEEQPVLELRRHQAQHPAQPAVLAEGRGHQVVAFVDDQQVPGQVRGALRGAAGGEELLQHVGLTQVVKGGDDAAE